MAERRMFSKRIINSAKFLKMPVSSQALYFHLGLHADDDGVVEAYVVMSSLGASEDDLRVLMAKGFVHVLNEDLITYILDWNENNKIRPDRKIDSIYKNLLLQVLPDTALVEKRARADTKKVTGQPMDGIGKDRIGKVRLGKDRIDYAPLYKSIVEYLNSKAGTSYRHTTKATQRDIHARLAEGYTEEDFFTVIEKMCDKWQGTEYEQYLRPSTLFGTKFESYLNCRVVKPIQQPKHGADRIAEMVARGDFDD